MFIRMLMSKKCKQNRGVLSRGGVMDSVFA